METHAETSMAELENAEATGAPDSQPFVVDWELASVWPSEAAVPRAGNP